MAADWSAIENAVIQWVREQSGLFAGVPPSQKVIWAHPNVNRPSGTYIDVQIGDISPVTAQDELIYIDHSDDEDPPAAGSEIEQQVQGLREFGVTLQCFAPPASASSPVPRGATGPRALLSKIQTSLRLPAVIAKFDVVKISCFDLGTVQYVPAISGTTFEGRATLEVRFYMNETASEFAGYIDSVPFHDMTGPPAEGTDDMDI